MRTKPDLRDVLKNNDKHRPQFSVIDHILCLVHHLHIIGLDTASDTTLSRDGSSTSGHDSQSKDTSRGAVRKVPSDCQAPVQPVTILECVAPTHMWQFIDRSTIFSRSDNSISKTIAWCNKCCNPSITWGNQC